ncbi:multiple sugar transport system permease protein [Caldalkalibacillus uzonensis]|uniref:Multiple sugar transport system permease protein n=1 Tax=Caldalkalibacillus uzonensis TaxID=353224 RepID=A0ABU0CVV3_9BACI|nr:carbohydrate ABC transporter permease [Caldalkalibacillus uzonensis]MDQ0340555.1 multiple sugar transport system permease protein [Caldalkalibacillus uzonensis]
MRIKGSHVIKYIILSIISLLMIIPLIWMMLTSLKEPARVFTQFFPWPIRWENYVEVLANTVFLRQYLNSIYIGIVVTVGTIIFSSMAGYAFARLNFFGRDFAFLLLLSMMMIPPEVTIIPLFLFMRELGWINTHIPLILLPIFGAPGAFGVFLMRQFFLTIPKELEEAAKIDGCSRWKVYWRLMLPLAVPAISTLTIFTFLQNWDEFLNPLIFINSRELMTLPVGLSLFTDETGTAWHHLMGATTLATIPLLIIFFFAQKKFIEGMTLGSVKE